MYKLNSKETICNQINFQLFAGKIVIICTNWFETHVDPATGTGTFLAEVIQQIRDKFNGLEGLWPSYVEKSLIPRIYGFEILMASYTIAHLKLSYTLKETGYSGLSNQRLNVFLTNSLEEATPRATNLFARWLSDEADAASKVKVDTPVMICLGNPPYSVSSQNNRTWILELIKDYKKNLTERNIQPLSDDYIKFIRLGQYYIDKNGEGVLAYISNNSFLDGLIHRQMRAELLKSFDDIFILNLHGNSRKQETCPDGSIDENVFDIMQGVSINIFIKSNNQKASKLANVHYADLFGSREFKYGFLSENTLESVQWNIVDIKAPQYFFVPKDFSMKEEYDRGFSISELMPLYKAGVATGKDDVLVNISSNELLKKCETFFSIVPQPSTVKTYSYRPFDTRYIYFDTTLVQRPRFALMKHLEHPNIALIVTSQNRQLSTSYFMVVNSIVDRHYLDSAADTAGVFPLYLYDDNGKAIVNVNSNIINRIEAIVGNSVTPESIFDYVYSSLFSREYQNKYKEFLKIDFPRIPYPSNAEHFFRLKEKGSELRELHLMKNPETWPTTVTFPVVGDNIVEKIVFTDGKVFINSTQYFGNVSDLAWDFFIGGYQPAQKWLKDRKGRKLDYQDILHYGHIIYVLEDTDRLMKEIDEIDSI